MKKNPFAPVLLAAASAASADGIYWQHIDPDPVPYVYAGSYSEDVEFGDYGKTDVVEAQVDLRFRPIEDFLWGDLSLGLGAHAFGFIDKPGMEAVPHALLDSFVEAAYALRFDNGWAWRVWARPGVYSDPVNPAFGCPAGLSLYFAATDAFSVQIGAAVRAGWDIPVVPEVGIKYRPSDLLELELGCPSSRLVLFPDHILSFFAAGEWRNVTYALDDDDESMPDKLTMDDVSVSAGASLRILGTFVLSGEFGTFLERELSADVETDHAVKLSKEPFVRVSLSGVF